LIETRRYSEQGLKLDRIQSVQLCPDLVLHGENLSHCIESWNDGMTGEVVLIIDDSDALRSLLETVLPYGGYRTICAGTGEDGLRLVLETQPDVILTDLELPDISGLKLLEELNGQGISIPTVMMTAYGSEGVAAQALKLGVRDYLIKPFTTEEVLSAIDRALKERRLQGEKESLAGMLRKYSLHFRLLATISRYVTSGPSRQEILQRIVEAGQFVTEADAAQLLLLNQTASQFRVVAAQGQADCVDKTFSVLAGDECLHAVVKEKVPVRLHSPPESTFELQTGERVKVVLQVPLKGSDRILGLLSVHRWSANRPFDEHDEQMMIILADYVVSALD
jgi:two-component system NtrC family sensor kinase